MTLEEMRALQRDIAAAMAHLEYRRAGKAWLALERAWLAITLATERTQSHASMRGRDG